MHGRGNSFFVTTTANGRLRLLGYGQKTLEVILSTKSGRKFGVLLIVPNFRQPSLKSRGVSE